MVLSLSSRTDSSWAILEVSYSLNTATTIMSRGCLIAISSGATADHDNVTRNLAWSRSICILNHERKQ